VPQARVYKVWNVAAFGNPDEQYLDILSDILTSGKSSRLHKRLVYDDQTATDVGSFNYTRQLGGLFVVFATAQPGGDLSAVEKALEEEVARLVSEGPTPEELERSKATQHAGFVRGIERVGGFGGKSDRLAASEVYYGSPDGHEAVQARILAATAEQVQAAAQRWVTPGVFTLEVLPFADYSAAEGGVDRTTGVPEVADFPTSGLPQRETATLSNGLRVILARRDAVPLVELNLLVDAGYAADQFGLPGTARLALDMQDEGTTSRDALQISDELESLGATLYVGSDLDTSVAGMSALKENLVPSLELLADVVLNPSFPEKELERLRKQQLAAIQREKVQPVQMALRVFPRLLYGDGHAYGQPLTGSGTEESVAALDRAALVDFHSTWFRPGNATLVVVGDVTLAELTPQLERLFSSWKPGETPEKNLAQVQHRPESVVYIVDRPGSEQSVLFAGHVVPPKNNPNELAIDALNHVFGGAFSARINMNLREDKHWSYGARSLIWDTAAQRPFIVYAPVQTDKTAEALAEIRKELAGIRPGGERPVTQEELDKVKDQKTLTLPGRWETNEAVLNDIVEMVRFDLDEDYWDTFPGKVRALTLDDVADQAEAALRPDQTVWVVVGDREKIESGVRALDLGEIRFIDADGQPAGD
jgi:zinc protease